MVHQLQSNVVSLIDHRSIVSHGASRTICRLGTDQVVVSFGQRRAETRPDDSDYAEFAALIGTLVARL